MHASSQYLSEFLWVDTDLDDFYETTFKQAFKKALGCVTTS